MELEVRVVGEIESCFVSLPLHLIQTLQQTCSSASPSGSLPAFLALELRPRFKKQRQDEEEGDGPHLWHVAWCGSASSSPAIEIAQQYAECICLPDHTFVHVRALANMPKATLVTIEPHTEDDWEILELNSEHAEAAILKQVGTVHEAMRFPLWLHGQTVVTFLVLSTFPKSPIVQLVPGTEVAVAPKRRKKSGGSYEDYLMQSSNKEHSIGKALLRVQDPDDSLTQKIVVNDVEIGVVLTSVIFIHPETARNHSFGSQPVVVMPRLPSKEGLKNPGTDTPSVKHTIMKKGNSGKQDYHQAVLHVLISNSVAKGHVMLSRSLRLYLGARLHSWIFVKRCNIIPKKEIPSLSFSPCHLNISENNNALENNGFEFFGGQRNHKVNNIHLKTNPESNIGTYDWSTHERVIAGLSNGLRSNDDPVAVNKTNKKVLYGLFQTWYSAQLCAIAKNAGEEVKSLTLGNQSLLHFVVKDYTAAKHGKVSLSSRFTLGMGNRDGEPEIDILYVLSSSEETQQNEKVYAYELAFSEGNMGDNNLRSSDLLLAKLNLGDPLFLEYVNDGKSEKFFSSKISSLGWMGTAPSDCIDRLILLLSPASGLFLSGYNLPFPGHVLIHGPPGSGKTLLATAAAKSVEEHEDILAHIVFVCCSKLALEKPANIRQALSGYVSEALDHAPSILIFDDLDDIISCSVDLEGSQPSSSSIEIGQFLTDIMDEYEVLVRILPLNLLATLQPLNHSECFNQLASADWIFALLVENHQEKRKCSCGIGPIAFVASAKTLSSIPQSLTSSGRFDFHVQLPAPSASERGALLKHEIWKRSLQCSDEVLLDIASKCDGYDAYDLEILVDRAIHAGICRFLSCDVAFQEHGKPSLLRDDFLQAMQGFVPVSMRDISKPATEGGRAGWEDVGGLTDIRNAIQEMIELPSKFPNIFSQAPLRLRSNVLLYGPPGCGKTHIVGAAAAACSLRFISVKGPELLNKYIGASEQAVRDIFSKAAGAAPCLLFFDEFDSIAPKRGHDNTGVTDRVVNQFLTELDGVEVLAGVFVFAATSRPDLLDAALLRPGRLDRLLFCDFPSKSDRMDILAVLSRKLSLASDVDLDAISGITEGFSGADLQALLSDAQLAAVHKLLDSVESVNHGKTPVITHSLLSSVAAKARPSVSETERRRLYSIYNQFLDSKRSVASQSRDAKGKRATLA